MTTKEFFSKLASGYVWGNLALMFMLIVVIAVGVIWGADLYTRHGETVTVPDIRNKKFADAERLLNDCGLTIVVTDTSYNRHLPPDCILQQTPLKGAVVKVGRIIYVTINASEKPSLSLPDIVDNSSEREAIAKLTILGFKVGETEYVAGEKGWVYGVKCRGKNVAYGDKVPYDAMVTLVVGNGSLNDNVDLEVTDAEYEYTYSNERLEEEYEVIEDNEADPFEVVEE